MAVTGKSQTGASPPSDIKAAWNRRSRWYRRISRHLPLVTGVGLLAVLQFRVGLPAEIIFAIAAAALATVVASALPRSVQPRSRSSRRSTEAEWPRARSWTIVFLTCVGLYAINAATERYGDLERTRACLRATTSALIANGRSNGSDRTVTCEVEEAAGRRR